MSAKMLFEPTEKSPTYYKADPKRKVFHKDGRRLSGKSLRRIQLEIKRLEREAKAEKH